MRSAIIPDFDNYTIYENGDVYSRVRRGGGGKIKPSMNIHNYPCVSLTKDSKSYTKPIHRLLGICFIPNPKNFPIIDHIDRNRSNNSLDNLRWCTYSTNNKNKETHGWFSNNKRIYKGKEYSYIRFCWNDDGKKCSKNFKTMEEAKEFQEYIRNIPKKISV